MPHAAGMQTIDDRRIVRVYAEHVSNVSSTDYPGTYPGEDHSWNLDKFKRSSEIKVHRLSNRSCEFDIVGVDASIANALRRILLSEVPTVAIENVYVFNNTSIIADEVLSHRLGLVPLNVDPALLETKDDPGSAATDRNTIVFSLNVSCSRNTNAIKGEEDPDELYINSNVYSSHLVWVPQGEQAEIFQVNSPAPVNQNILLAKLRPGQELNMELHAVKGVGKEHAKWSPVDVIQIRINPQTDEEEAYVASPRKESMSREVFRHEEFHGKVELGRIRVWFIFNVESEGPYAFERLLIEAISIMREKIATVRKSANALFAELDSAASANIDVEMAR